MIGNDIIDLKIAIPGNKSKNHRFLNKIFTEGEKATIRGSGNPEIRLWQLWSMKEAAYKAHQRLHNLSRKLNPTSFECFINSKENSGSVKIGEETYLARAEITSKYIHSIVHREEIHQIIYVNNKKPKEKFILDISSELTLEDELISISKDSNGIPSLSLKKEGKKIPFSLSHHGDFSAFVFPLINC